MAMSLKRIGRKSGLSLNGNSESDKYRFRADELADERKKADTVDQANASRKKLANHEWYVHNKDVKQKYNKEYYANNTDYWRKRYLAAKNEYDRLDREYYRAWDEKEASQRRGDLGGAKNMAEYQQSVEWKMGKTWPEMEQAEENYKRAMREETEFLKSQKKMPFTEAWSQGAQAIVNTGKNFISAITGR